ILLSSSLLLLLVLLILIMVLSFPTRRPSDLGVQDHPVRSGQEIGRLQKDRRTVLPRQARPFAVGGAGRVDRALNLGSAGLVPDELGRAHVWTPVTFRFRMPSFACKQQD